ncbi:hypothetical protein [Streptomyces sp. WG-D5]
MAYLAPGSFGIPLSIQFLVMAVVSSLGTVWGPLAGASSITLLLHWLNDIGAQPGMPDYAPQVFSYADAFRQVAHRTVRERSPTGGPPKAPGRAPKLKEVAELNLSSPQAS